MSKCYGYTEESQNEYVCKNSGKSNLSTHERSFCRNVFFFRIVCLARSITKTAFFHDQICRKIRRRLKNKQQSEEKIRQFDNLSRKIAGISIIRNKWSILSLLDSLRDSTSEVPFSSISTLDASSTSQKIPENIIRAPEPARPASELLFSNKSKRKFDWSLTHWRVDDETDFRDSEQIILRNMIFALQGIDGQYIKYSTERGKYVVSDNVSIPPPTIKFIEKICEGGALYRRVKACLSLSTTSQGRVRQSFSEVVRKLLSDYFRLLAVLESQIIQTSLSSTSKKNDKSKENEEKENNALTLRRLHVWLIDPLERLRVLADLCESTRAAEGGALASATFLHVQHGDETVRNLVQDVMSAISLPLFQIM